MSDYELEYLSVKIVEWKRLARRLGFWEDEIEQFDIYNTKFTDKVYMMLMRWKVREYSDATYQVLHEALCHPLVNRRDLAVEFCIDKSSFSVSTSSSRLHCNFQGVIRTPLVGLI